MDELRRMFEFKLKLHPDTLQMLLPITCWSRGRLHEVMYIVRLAEAIARGEKRATVLPKDIETAIADRRRAAEVAARPATIERRAAAAV